MRILTAFVALLLLALAGAQTPLAFNWMAPSLDFRRMEMSPSYNHVLVVEKTFARNLQVGTVAVFDVATGKPIWRFTGPVIHDAHYNPVTSDVIVGTPTGLLRLDRNTGISQGEYLPGLGAKGQFGFVKRNDGALLMLSALRGESVAKLFDVTPRIPTFVRSIPLAAPFDASFNEDGRIITPFILGPYSPYVLIDGYTYNYETTARTTGFLSQVSVFSKDGKDIYSFGKDEALEMRYISVKCATGAVNWRFSDFVDENDGDDYRYTSANSLVLDANGKYLLSTGMYVNVYMIGMNRFDTSHPRQVILDVTNGQVLSTSDNGEYDNSFTASAGIRRYVRAVAAPNRQLFHTKVVVTEYDGMFVPRSSKELFAPAYRIFQLASLPAQSNPIKPGSVVGQGGSGLVLVSRSDGSLLFNAPSPGALTMRDDFSLVGVGASPMGAIFGFHDAKATLWEDRVPRFWRLSDYAKINFPSEIIGAGAVNQLRFLSDSLFSVSYLSDQARPIYAIDGTTATKTSTTPVTGPILATSKDGTLTATLSGSQIEVFRVSTNPLTLTSLGKTPSLGALVFSRKVPNVAAAFTSSKTLRVLSLRTGGDRKGLDIFNINIGTGAPTIASKFTVTSYRPPSATQEYDFVVRISGDGQIGMVFGTTSLTSTNRPTGFLDFVRLTDGVIIQTSRDSFLGGGYQDAAFTSDSNQLILSTRDGWLQAVAVPPFLHKLEVNPTSVKGNSLSTGTVTVQGTGVPGSTVIRLTSNSESVKVPEKVFLPHGAKTVSFQIATFGVTTQTTAIITATLGYDKKTTTLTVTP